MSTRVGMVTSTLDHGLSGPNRVLFNICDELNSRQLNDFDLNFIHNEPSDLSIYTPDTEVILPRAPVRFERALAKLDLDIVYYPHFPKLRPGFFFLDAKKVIHLHGDLPYAMPSLMSVSERYRQYAIAAFYRSTKLSQQVDAYFAASDSLINNKIRELGVPKEKFFRTEYAPAISTRIGEKSAQDEVLERFELTPGYILDVASNSERKNITNLLNAVASLHQSGINVPKLVIAGDWRGTETHHYGKEILGDNVVFTGYVDDDVLAHIYHGAGLYANPTRHEAFGLTNLEAMAAGLPVITSNKFAVPEVVGDAALLIDDPEDTDEIANKIQLVIENADLRSELSDKSRMRAEMYTWEKTVDTIVSVFKELS
ncbi:glycosyltransferase family 4 protein [Haloarcula sp. JP-Z28]|uniref:glycosyltransferase family 4 protein n=1 Tax=Haloarcula sp. JP-Z28 TaxID=2716715 RepID=UPI0014046DB7|nr:glycosyltransferase family 1 protein [Haloarcula sp. JP-Z28]NHN66006.1 glycosyltransferase family 4 protein [Haloarcula sp. JP-Z28]